MKRAQHNSLATLISLGISLLIVAAFALVFFYRQAIVDHVRADLLYDAPAEIVALADATTMTKKGKLYFYASEPVLESTTQFNEECQRQEEGNSILGCYKNGKIYIFDVQDERLKGVEEVTAAHEMLHAAYQRLSGRERSRIDDLLEKEYTRLRASDDDLLKERMEYYARTEPGERANELHSILPTEMPELSRELEEYYQTYFTDRSVIVRLHASYNGKFEELNSSSEQLASRLESLSQEIDRLTVEYNDAMLVLNNDIARFNARAEAPGGFATEAAFQAERADLLARVAQGEQQRAEIDAKLQEHEQMRQAYNANKDEAESLMRSLDSKLAPAPSL